MSDVDKYMGLMDQGLAPLGNDVTANLKPIVWALFQMVYKDLEKAIVCNPVEHHLIVLKHMMEIVKGEMSPYIVVEQAAALALLHDIAPVKKITTQMVDQTRHRSTAMGEVFELKRQENRMLHMQEGCVIANLRMIELNERMRKIVFDAQSIQSICEVIRIHDNPSINISIPKTNWLAVAFREADRLWMITPEGIYADLSRQQKSNNMEAYRKQLDANLERFREERLLYRSIESIEGPFCDDATFFRTKTGYSLYRRLLDLGKKKD